MHLHLENIQKNMFLKNYKLKKTKKVCGKGNSSIHGIIEKKINKIVITELF